MYKRPKVNSSRLPKLPTVEKLLFFVMSSHFQGKFMIRVDGSTQSLHLLSAGKKKKGAPAFPFKNTMWNSHTFVPTSYVGEQSHDTHNRRDVGLLSVKHLN